jgi:hypothetical protein
MVLRLLCVSFPNKNKYVDGRKCMVMYGTAKNLFLASRALTQKRHLPDLTLLKSHCKVIPYSCLLPWSKIEKLPTPFISFPTGTSYGSETYATKLV